MSKAFKNARWSTRNPFGFHIHDSLELRQVKEWLTGKFFAPEMTDCPCCGQVVKLYPRKISAQMCRALAALTYGRASSADLIRRTGCNAGAGNHTLLQHWNFIREIEIQAKDGTVARYWVLTDSGRSFAYGMSRAPKYALVFNNKVFGFSEEEVFIEDCITDEFNLGELLAPTTIANRQWTLL